MSETVPPPSPFLPGTNIQFAFDSTSLGYLKTCARLYQYVMIDGWQSPGESIHLRFGIELHSALEGYERLKAEGMSSPDAVREVVRQLLTRTVDWHPDEESRAGKYKNRTSLVRTVIDYLDHYANDPATTYIKADGKPAVELSFNFELDFGPKAGRIYCPSTKSIDGGSASEQVPCDGFINESGNFEGGCGESCNFVMHPETGVVKDRQPYLLSGHLDRVINFNDELFVLDHKTTTSTPGSYYFDQYHPNNQMTLYTLAAGIILGAPVKGVMIDAIQVAVGFTRMVRGMTFRTQDQLEEWIDDLRNWLALAETYATNNYWPMNDTSCDKFGGCRFREICSKSPHVRENFLKSHYVKLPAESRWNPLAER